MAIGLHNVYYGIGASLRNMQVAQIAPDSGGAGESRGERGDSVAPPVYHSRDTNPVRGLLIATVLSVGIWIGIGLLVCEVTHGR